MEKKTTAVSSLLARPRLADIARSHIPGSHTGLDIRAFEPLAHQDPRSWYS